MRHRKTTLTLLLAALPLAAAGARADGGAESWTGPYAGIAAGPQFDQSTWTATSVGPGNVYGIDPSDSRQRFNDGHGRAGGFVGWSIQPLPDQAPDLLAGIEADIFGIIGGQTSRPGLPGVAYNGLTPTDTLSQTQSYDASVRARAGSRVTPEVLLYGTAGVAFRDLDIKGNCPASGPSPCCGVSESESQSKTLVGWTAGIGAETVLTGRFTIRAEYRYADYGTITATLFAAANQGADQFSGKTDLSSHIITLGIAYHFGM